MEKKTTKKRSWAPWLFVSAIFLINIFLFSKQVGTLKTAAAVADGIIWTFTILTFASVGTLILTRQRRHIIGWLLVIFPIVYSVSSILDLFVRVSDLQASQLSIGQFLFLWFSAWSWWLLIGPILLIFLLYPTGHLISKGWRWAVVIMSATFALFIFVVSFSPTVENEVATRTWPNPYGFLSDTLVETLLGLMGIMLISSALAAALSVFVRYRRSQAVERAQLRWLFLATSIFFLVYLLAFATSAWGGGAAEVSDQAWYTLLFDLSVLTIPLSIGFAILRYRLWDIDVVINRSLVYAVLTTLLAGIFTATATLLTQIARAAFGEEMQQAAAAVAAIFVASIFQPMRAWVESGINRRLFPENIDLSQGLVEINPDFWVWVGLPKIMNATLDHVEDIYSCSTAAIYLKKSQNEFLPVAALGIPLSKLEPFKLNKEEQESLQRKKGILHEKVDPFAISIPIHLPRRKDAEILGVLRLGKRKAGRGYSGDDVKTLVSFGAKLGQPVYAFAAAKKT